MISLDMNTVRIFGPECFVTELTGVAESLYVNLDVLLDVGQSVGLVITNLAVEETLPPLDELLYPVIHCPGGHGLNGRYFFVLR